MLVGLLLVLAQACLFAFAVDTTAHDPTRWNVPDSKEPRFLSDSVLLAHREYTLEDVFVTRSAFVTNATVSPQDHALRNDSGASPHIHPPLWPLSAGDVLSFALAAFSLFLASGGGIGGGGVLVPVFILGMHFTTEKAVALSNLTIAGGAFANLLCNIQRRHPTGLKPLIDWDLILVMEPMTICGAVFGGYLNKLLPIWFTSIAMSVMLLLMSWNLWKKAVKQYRRESQEILQRSFDLDALGEPFLAHELFPSANKNLVTTILQGGDAMQLAVLSDEDRAAAKRILVSESRQVPRLKLFILVALFVWIFATDMWKSKVTCGSLQYWALVLSIVPIVMALMAWFRGVLVHKAQVKGKVGLVQEEGDINWTTKSTVFYPAICSLAGLVAGLFGVGGGIVKGPLLLEMGVLPEVAAATSATMILFTTGAASVVYLAFGGIPWDYAGTLIVMGFVITFIGQMLTYSIIHRLGRRSIIIIAMGSLLTLGCVIMWYESVLAIIEASKTGFFHIASLCQPKM